MNDILILFCIVLATYAIYAACKWHEADKLAQKWREACEVRIMERDEWAEQCAKYKDEKERFDLQNSMLLMQLHHRKAKIEELENKLQQYRKQKRFL